MFSVFRSSAFERKLERMPNEFVRWIGKIESQLCANPYVGDQLRVPWFREKKFGAFRIYYLIYEDLYAVYIVNMSEKKDQQRVIDTIFLLLDLYRNEIKNLVQS